MFDKDTKMIKMMYLDASALVKLYVDEGDCKPIREFFRSPFSLRRMRVWHRQLGLKG